MLGGWFHKSQSPIGLDLGTHSIRLLQIEQPETGARVVAAAQSTISQPWPEDRTARLRAQASLLAELIDTGGFRGKEVISSLPAGQMQYRNLRLPKMPEDELHTAVTWEAGDRLKLPGGEQPVVQFVNAGQVRQGEEIRQEIILMAAPSSAVEEHLELLELAGLKARAIDAAPMALGRCILRQRTESADEARCVIDVGHACTKVLVIRGGGVIFFKTIDIAGRTLIQTLAQKLRLPEGDAAVLYRQLAQGSLPQGDAQSDQVEATAREALQGQLSELAREIALCLRYCSVTFRGRKPETAQLTGAGADDRMLIQQVQQEGGLQVTLSNPFQGVDLTRVPFLRDQVNLAGWATALGLALRDGRSTQQEAA